MNEENTEKRKEKGTTLTSILRQAQNRMFTRSVLPQHRRRHDTRAAAHVDNDAPRGPPLRVLLAHGFQFLLLHGGRLRAGGEEHAENVDVEEALEFTDGGLGDLGGGLHADLAVFQRPGRCLASSYRFVHRWQDSSEPSFASCARETKHEVGKKKTISKSLRHC